MSTTTTNAAAAISTATPTVANVNNSCAFELANADDCVQHGCSDCFDQPFLQRFPQELENTVLSTEQNLLISVYGDPTVICNDLTSDVCQYVLLYILYVCKLSACMSISHIFRFVSFPSNILFYVTLNRSIYISLLTTMKVSCLPQLPIVVVKMKLLLMWNVPL